MSIGKMNIPIKILNEVKQSDGQGGFIISYNDKAELWASSVQVPVNNTITERNKESREAFKIIVRLPNELRIYLNDIIEMSGDRYQIINIADATGKDNRYYKEITIAR